MHNLKILIKHLKGSIWKSQIQYLTFFLIACIVCFSSSPSCNREKYTSLSGTPMPCSPPHCPEPPKSAKTIKPREGDSVGRSGPHVTAPGPSLPAERAMSRPHSGRFPGCHGTIRTEGDSGDPGKGAGRRWGSSPALSLQPPSSEGPPQCTSHGCGLSAAERGRGPPPSAVCDSGARVAWGSLSWCRATAERVYGVTTGGGVSSEGGEHDCPRPGTQRHHRHARL